MSTYFIPCLSLTQPSEHRVSFWSGWLAPPKAEACPSQSATTLVDLVDVAFLPARLLGDVCTAVSSARMGISSFRRETGASRALAPSHLRRGTHRGWALERPRTTSQRDEFPSDLNLADPALQRCCRTSTEQLSHPCHTCNGLLVTSHLRISNSR